MCAGRTTVTGRLVTVVVCVVLYGSFHDTTPLSVFDPAAHVAALSVECQLPSMSATVTLEPLQPEAFELNEVSVSGNDGFGVMTTSVVPLIVAPDAGAVTEPGSVRRTRTWIVLSS